MCNMFRDDDRHKFQIDHVQVSLMKHYSHCHPVTRVVDPTVLTNIAALSEQQRQRFPIKASIFRCSHRTSI